MSRYRVLDSRRVGDRMELDLEDVETGEVIHYGCSAILSRTHPNCRANRLAAAIFTPEQMETGATVPMEGLEIDGDVIA